MGKPSFIERMDVDGVWRRCGNCREWLPADSEFYPWVAGRRLSGWCRVCTNERTARYYHAKREKGVK